ncbi:MAG: AAA family ATPase [Candidatus Omnitrophota bacterium]|jgi:CO dehydrogenase maturation factor
MGSVIAVAGKGGSGKTTVSALLVRLIREAKTSSSVLAIDADPNSNLAEVLGVKPAKSIGSVLDGIAQDPSRIPSGMPKERYIEYELQTAIEEAGGFDILTMGRPEGPGCYCYVNNVLRNIMAGLIRDYDYVIIDNEAGLEHLSRRTTRSADVFLVISDPTPVGLRAAQRIIELAEELRIAAAKKLLIINRALLKERCRAASNRQKFMRGEADFLGYLPQDNRLAGLSLNGSPLTQLRDDSVSISAMRRLMDKIL